MTDPKKPPLPSAAASSRFEGEHLDSTPELLVTVVADLPALTDWISDAEAKALCDGDTQGEAAVLVAGRLLRAAMLPGGGRARLEEALRRPPLRAATRGPKAALLEGRAKLLKSLESLNAGSCDAYQAWALLAERDNLESLSWSHALGRADADAADTATDPSTATSQTLQSALQSVDKLGDQLRPSLARSLAHSRPPVALAWLPSVARAASGAWWTDLVLGALTSHRLERFLSRSLVGAALRPALQLPPNVRASAGLSFAGGSTNEAASMLARPLGPAIGSLFDGEVLVHAHGLAQHDQEVVPGLVVRHRDGEFQRILEVALVPAADHLPQRSDLALAYWVPLSGTAQDTLQLRVQLQHEGDTSTQTEALDLALPPAKP